MSRAEAQGIRSLEGVDEISFLSRSCRFLCKSIPSVRVPLSQVCLLSFIEQVNGGNVFIGKPPAKDLLVLYDSCLLVALRYHHEALLYSPAEDDLCWGLPILLS